MNDRVLFGNEGKGVPAGHDPDETKSETKTSILIVFQWEGMCSLYTSSYLSM